MKKLIALILGMALCMMAALPALADASAGTTAGAATDIATGAWAATDDAAVSEDVLALFNAAIDCLTGATLEPVAVLGTQVVAGTNYCILCRATPVVENPVPGYTLLYLYAAADGTSSILGMSDIDMGATLDAILAPETDALAQSN